MQQNCLLSPSGVILVTVVVAPTRPSAALTLKNVFPNGKKKYRYEFPLTSALGREGGGRGTGEKSDTLNTSGFCPHDNVSVR